MTPKQINELLRQVAEQARALHIPISERIQPQVVINRRAKNRFGCCFFKNGFYTIELSERLLNAPERSICQTLAHEILHTCPDCANHGASWKAWAARMNAAYGYQISRTDTADKLGLPDDDVPAPYLLVCTRCGAEITRTRRTSVVEHPERYHCRCGGRLERKR